MISCFLSPAKINLYLKIVGKRHDGYHLLESVVSLVSLFDIIKIQPLTKNTLVLNSSHKEIPLKTNLVLQAANLLKERTGCKQGAHIILKKNIPIGAGLGGGSSNAATTLIALNYLWKTGLSTAQLKTIGLQLGADVPFFILGRNALITGIGEILQSVVLKKSFYIIIFPNIPISTKKIFNSLILTHATSTGTINDYGNMPIVNDLQTNVFRLYPELKVIAQLLGPFGKPVMTGSGSAMFIKTKSREESLFIKNQLTDTWQVYCAETLAQHPLNGLKENINGESSSG